MLRDITLGQYYQTESIIHKLDARIKIIATFWFIISIFIINRVSGYIVAAAFLAAVIRLSHVPFRYMIKGLKSILILLLITFAFNIFLTPGEILVAIGPLSISKEGLFLALKMAIRLMFLIIGSSVMTLTTTPNNLTDALEKLFSPLKLFHVPVHEVAMMMSIALRFIPILIDETDKIMKAQMARGADFESGSLVKRAVSLGALLEPLFISAFQRANDLAMAMESRCYRGGEGRTKMKPLVYQKRDYLARVLIYVYVILCILIGRVLPLPF